MIDSRAWNITCCNSIRRNIASLVSDNNAAMARPERASAIGLCCFRARVGPIGRLRSSTKAGFRNLLANLIVQKAPKLSFLARHKRSPVMQADPLQSGPLQVLDGMTLPNVLLLYFACVAVSQAASGLCCRSRCPFSLLASRILSFRPAAINSVRDSVSDDSSENLFRLRNNRLFWFLPHTHFERFIFAFGTDFELEARIGQSLVYIPTVCRSPLLCS